MRPASTLALALLAAALLLRAAAGGEQCSGAPALPASNDYSAVFASRTPSDSVLEGLLSRSVSQRDHAVVDAAARGWSGMPGWDNSQLAYLIQPSKGANFAMYLADMGPRATGGPKSPIVERFILVLDGQLEVEVNGEEVAVPADHFAYQPPSSEEFLSQTLTSKKGAKLVVFERIFGKAEGMPVFLHGAVADAPVAAAGANSSTAVRALLPDSEEWDMEVTVVDVKPGFAAPPVTGRYNNYGVVVLAGEGVLRVGNTWHAAQAGDAAWAGPYVRQWFAALGPRPARLLVYRDRNIDPLMAP